MPRLRAIATIVITAAAFAHGQSVTDPEFTISTVATGLAQPTGMAMNGSDLWVIEKATGRVKRRTGNGTFGTVLDLPVNSNSERGLLGIALHPQFQDNGYVYLYHSVSSTSSDTTSSAQWTENRVSRYTFNGSALTNGQSLLSFPSSSTEANGPNHDGGVLRFGPDGKLYGITGDLNRQGLEQNRSTVTSGTGGIFRINDDGSTPADNPFINHPSPVVQKWYAYGVRNGFGLRFDPMTGDLWDTENGPSVYDEVNRITPGFNSGWNRIMGPASRSGASGDLVHIPGSTYGDPAFSWLNPIAATSIEFLTGPRFALDYSDAVLVGDNNTQGLYLFRLNEARDGFELAGTLADLVADNATERNLNRFGNGFGVMTDLQIGPDGALYALNLSGGTLIRLSLPIIADFNGDERVDVADLGILATNFRNETSAGRQAGDANRDGVVDVADLGILATYFRFGTDLPAMSFAEMSALLESHGLPTIPEPAAGGVLLASLLLLRKRR